MNFETLENEIHADIERQRETLFADHVGADGLIDWDSYHAAVDALGG